MICFSFNFHFIKEYVIKPENAVKTNGKKKDFFSESKHMQQKNKKKKNKKKRKYGERII